MARKIAWMPLAVAASCWFGGALAQERYERHDLAPDIDAFHSVLAPVWHARPGKERSRSACAKADQMAVRAEGIRSADASALRAAVAALKETCKSKPADIDGAFHDVHEAFHGLIGPRPAN